MINWVMQNVQVQQSEKVVVTEEWACNWLTVAASSMPTSSGVISRMLQKQFQFNIA